MPKKKSAASMGIFNIEKYAPTHLETQSGAVSVSHLRPRMPDECPTNEFAALPLDTPQINCETNGLCCFLFEGHGSL